MAKLLTRYIDNPTLENAQKLRAYSRQHPMAACLLTRDHADLLAGAIHHANAGRLNPAAE